MHRLGKDSGGESVAHSHSPHFERSASGQSPRLLAGVPNSDPLVISTLAGCLSGPLHVLYVLHTARGEGQLGRYQSPELTHQQLDAFLRKYSELLSQDGRFDLWIYSPSDSATLVWDRHDQLFAYGPVDRFESHLLALGFSAGKTEIPSPHIHHYRSALDPLARELFGEFDWTWSALRPEDEQ